MGRRTKKFEKSCCSQPYVKVPNTSYKFYVKFGEVQNDVRISKQEYC